MARIWSEEAKLERWLKVELAALEAWGRVGIIPSEVIAAIRDQATVPSPARVAEIERETGHDVAAFVDAVAESLGKEGCWFHYGLTSSDVTDTALALAVRDAGALLLEGLDRTLAVIIERAREHRDTLMIGRTHGVHAEPTTFGLKLAGWAFQLARDRER
ncbi:MAG: lyase family protein, partial [Nitrososphaerales archaeon]